MGFRSDRSEEASDALARLVADRVPGALFPHYPWYFLVLVPFLALAAVRHGLGADAGGVLFTTR